MNKEQLVTLTLQEIDSTLFETLTVETRTLYPSDHRQALRVAMHIADKVMAQFEAVAVRQGRSQAAKAAAEARWAQTQPAAIDGITASSPAGIAAFAAGPASAPTPPKKRNRRTKAQIAADLAAAAAAPVNPGLVPPAPQIPTGFVPPPQPGPQAQPFVPPAPQAPAAPTTADVDAAIAAASGSPVNAPPPPLTIPTFGS